MGNRQGRSPGDKKARNRNGRVLGTLGAVDDAVPVPFHQAITIKSILGSRGENGPVRILTHRVGEVANLADPVANQRSKAAILAKKYFEQSQKLRNIYNASQKRELKPEEVATVFAIWENLKNGLFETELAGTGSEPPGGLDPTGGGPGGEDAQEGGGHGGDDQDLACSMAGPEEDEADPCL